MKLTTASSGVTVTRRATLADGPTLKAGSSSAGRNFRVEHITINYDWRDGQWVTQWDSSFTLAGPYLKKDGTDSASRTAQAAPFGYVRGEVDLPWLDQIVDLLRPAGDIQLTAVHGLEVEA